ncbi:MAG: AsmA-like C-terminal region-containing protein [Bacteroidota bacterium]
MKKKVFRILGIVLLVLILTIVALPWLLKGKMANLVKEKVNQNVNATFDFAAVDLSLIKSFPNAYLDLQSVSLVNKAPFEGDTLFAADHIALQLSLAQLFQGEDKPLSIEQLTLEGLLLHIKVDTLANANYDIAVADAETDAEVTEEDDTGDFTLNLKAYALNDATIIYDDFSSGMHLELKEMHHSGTGDLSLDRSQLNTHTDALVSFEMDSTRYLKDNTIALDALLDIDLAQSKYTFLENKALINQLPLVFDGFVKVNEDNQEVDVTFKTPSSDFKNFLALIPEAYAANIDNVKTTGNFEVGGFFKGVVDEDHIPTFGITLNSTDASFKYPDLPKAVTQVFIDTEINNETGIVEDTYVDIKRISFQIDQDKFNLTSKIRELLGNTKVNLHADGTINLANISQAYPLPEDYDLTGILTADVTTAFDMASIESHQYENTATSGNADLKGFEYTSEALNHPMAIDEASLTFNPTTVALNAFKVRTGETDFSAQGTIDNLLGYLFNSENMEGRFALSSNTFVVDDFMVAEVEETTAEEAVSTAADSEQLKIPPFLDCTVTAKANTVLYDNLTLKAVSGEMRIKDETVYLKDLRSSLFDGNLLLNGAVSTKEVIPTFDMALGLDAIKISESFQMLDMFKMLAPVANALEGRLNTDIKISGNLKEDMTPNLATLSGDLLAQMLSNQVKTANTPVLAALDNQFGFLDFEKLNLKDVQTALSFEGGKVNVKPFDIKYKDMVVQVSGNHTFDHQLQYQAKIDVPAKYLGEEVNKLIAQINDDELEGLTVPVTAAIGGSYTSPTVKSDLTSGIKNLTSQLVEIQKQKLLNQGKSKAKSLIGGLLDGGQQTDSTAATGNGVTEALGGLLGSGKQQNTTTDSSATQGNTVKEAAKNVLGGLFGKKKKDSVK